MGADGKIGVGMHAILYRHVVQSKKMTWGGGRGGACISLSDL